MRLLVVMFLALVAAPLHAAPLKMFATEFTSPAHFYAINPTTGAGTVIGNTTTFVPGLDFRSNGVLYGSSGSLMTINLTTGLATTIAPLADLMVSIAFGPNDALFAVNNAGTTLFKVNPSTGTTISSVPLTGTSLGDQINGIDFAPDGTLYGIGAALFSINPSTGVATRITPQNVINIAGPGIIFDDMDYDANGLIRALTFAVGPNTELWTINPATGLAISSALTHLNIDGLASVPEPSGLALAAIAFASLAAMRRRRRCIFSHFEGARHLVAKARARG